MDQLPFAPSQEETTELNLMGQNRTSRPNIPEVHNLLLDTGRIPKDPGMIPIPPSPPTSNSSTPTSTTDSSKSELWKRVVEAMVARDMRSKKQSGEEPPSKESLILSSLPGERNEKGDEPQSEKPTQEDIEEMNLQSHSERPDQCSMPQSSTGESTPPPELQERHGESTPSQEINYQTHTSREISPAGAQTSAPPVRQKSSSSNPKLPQRDPLASVAGYINGITKSLYNSHAESTKWPGKKEEWPRKKGYWIGDRSFQWIPGSPLKKDPGTYPPCTPTQPLTTPGTQLPGTAGNPPGQTPHMRPYGPIPWLERPSTKTYGTHFPPLYSWEGNTEQSRKKKKKVKIAIPPLTPPLIRTKPSMSLVLNFSTEDIFNTKKPGGDWTKPHLPTEVFWTTLLDPELGKRVPSLSQYRGTSHPEVTDEGMDMDCLKRERRCFRCGHTGHIQKSRKCDLQKEWFTKDADERRNCFAWQQQMGFMEGQCLRCGFPGHTRQDNQCPSDRSQWRSA
ncbi:uncharacterized protein EV420DRAFT_1650049 [Desarmillaria tabescens]|uniref:CCHC-type domain-containing protein n=1 Tax=Armillaria tabescens TaxID=1929756 RepID=A0AA39MP79_ARMTA|nr:uncharacterized protein EV420DRAFT_1650049 [Desarmillaria tabescens]KAK0441542.1 hypothetical protein EV420DRAFT_1650049 [Desarmillaria tabescens]